MWRRNIDCLGVAVSIASDVPSIDDQLTGVFRTYADTVELPAVTYQLGVSDWPVVERGDGWRKQCDTELDLVPTLELDLYAEVTTRAAGLVLHAAAVVGGNARALIFAGISGAGKSTLLRALLARGFDYLSEECVALGADGTCIGLARAMHVEDASVLPPAGATRAPYTLRTAAGTKTTWLDHPSPDRTWRERARPIALACIGHGPSAPDRLTPISGGDAVAKLWPAVLRPRVSDLVHASPALAAMRCYGLSTTTPQSALSLALEMAQENGVEPRR